MPLQQKTLHAAYGAGVVVIPDFRADAAHSGGNQSEEVATERDLPILDDTHQIFCQNILHSTRLL